jgi:hypothetical protein
MSKKITISKDNFSEMDIYDPNYKIRFRIVSEDRNRFSAWSPIFSVNQNVTFVAGTTFIPGALKLSKGNGYVSAVWDSVSIYKTVNSQERKISSLPYYDVWIQLLGNGGANPSDWIYKGRLASTSLDINYDSTYPYTGGTGTTRQMKVEIYRPGRPVVQNSSSSFLMYSAIITTL